MNILSDPSAEKAVLAACYRYGKDVYFDVVDVLRPSTFTIEYNEILFACIKHIYEKLELDRGDVASLHSAAKDLGLSYRLKNNECALHIKQIIDFDCDAKTARKLAAKIRKLEIARALRGKLEDAQDKILEVTGNETVTGILGIAENSIFGFGDVLESGSDDPKRVDSEGLTAHLEEILNNPVSQVGISSGFPRWDASIGGGLRKGTINLIGARTKGFKSGIALNVANYVASHGVPVLYLDTEMSWNDQVNRLLACRCAVDLTSIETGKFAEKEFIKSRVYQEVANIKNIDYPFYHKSIAGALFEDQLAIMRRWLFKDVGVRGDEVARPCLIVYDYLKMMATSDMHDLSEHQAFGFIMTALHNFCVKYQLPILTFVQLNRDGIDRESTSAISQSDRIGWLCSNFTIFKRKGNEELEQDGLENGNYKLVPIIARHGAGLEDGDYINVHAKKHFMQAIEGKLKSEVISENSDELGDGPINM